MTVPQPPPLRHYTLISLHYLRTAHSDAQAAEAAACYLWRNSPPFFIWDVYVKSMVLGEGEAEEGKEESRPGPWLVCDGEQKQREREWEGGRLRERQDAVR